MSRRIEGRAMFIKSTSLMKNQESYVDANILCPMHHCKRKTFNSVYSFPDPKLTWICVGSALNWLIFFSIKTLLIRDILCYLTLREKFPNTDQRKFRISTLFMQRKKSKTYILDMFEYPSECSGSVWYTINHGSHWYYRTNYVEGNWDAMLEQMNKNHTVLFFCPS